MIIKLTKLQWAFIGKTAGWMSPKFTYDPDDPKFSSDLSFMTEEDWAKFDQAQKEKEQRGRVCPQCKGEKFITEKIKDLGTLDFRDSIEACPMCGSKGYVTPEDHEAYLHSMGVVECPHCKSAQRLDSSKWPSSTNHGEIYTVTLFANRDKSDMPGYWQWYEAADKTGKMVAQWNAEFKGEGLPDMEPRIPVISKKVLGVNGTHAIRRFQDWQRLGLGDAWLREAVLLP